MPLLLATYYVGLVAWAYRDYAMDDAYIGFRYVANLLSGNGFTFEPGIRVEGVTNVAWLLLLVPLSTILAPPLAAKVLGTALVGLTLWLVVASAHRLSPRTDTLSEDYRLVPGLTAVLVVTSADFIAFSMLGMETAFLGAVVAAMVWVSFGGTRIMALAGLGALAFLIHPEAVLLLPLALATAALSRTLRVRDCIRCLAVFIVLLALATGARMAYFGAALPNTFTAKPSTSVAVLGHAVFYATGRFANVSQPFTSPFALVPVVVAYFAIKRAAPLPAAIAAAACANGLVFSLYASPDWTGRGRYFAPYSPVALMLLSVGGVAMARSLINRTNAPKVAVAALVAGVAFPGLVDTFHMISDESRLSYPGYVATGRTLVEPALWIRDNLPRNATIATRRVGILGYYSGHPIFDYAIGLGDRRVAQLVRRHRRHFDAPDDEALGDLWRARAPDYVLEDDSVINKLAGRSGTRASFRIHGLEYRVVNAFPIGRETEWTLVGRVTPRTVVP